MPRSVADQLSPARPGCAVCVACFLHCLMPRQATAPASYERRASVQLGAGRTPTGTDCFYSTPPDRDRAD